MTMAVTDAVARGQQAVLCASTGNTSASAAAYAARAGITCAVLIPQGKIAMGKLAQAVMHGAEGHPDRRQLRRLPGTRPQDRRRLPDHLVGQLGQPDAHRGPEDRGVRDRRRAGRRAGRPRPAGRQRGQHHRVLEGLHRISRRRRDRQAAAHAGHPGGRRGALGARRTGEPSRDHRHRDPHRLTGVVGVCRRGAAAVQGTVPGRHRRRDPGRISPGGRHRGRLRGTSVGGQHRRSSQGRRRRLGGAGIDGGVHRDRQRPQGSRHGAKGHAERVRRCPSTPSPLSRSWGSS